MTASDIDLPAQIEPVARRLLGDPNKALSSRAEWRYGTNGSLAVDLKAGTWFDHESQVGGGVLDLIRREIGTFSNPFILCLTDASALRRS